MDSHRYFFSGQWITSAEFAGLKPVNVFHRQSENAIATQTRLENKHILFRKKFRLDKTGVLALIRISADDYYKLYINGVFVSQGPCPGYPFHYYYNTLDIAPFLRPGDNVIAVHTYYQGLINRVWVSGDNRHGLLLDLEVNGETIVKSDETFLVRNHSGFAALGKAGYDTAFLEQYDSASPEDGFERLDYDDKHWEQASLKQNADWEVFPQPTRQLDFERIYPASVKKGHCSWVVDFGGNYAGYFVCKGQGRKSDKITLRFGQELDGNGNVRYELRANCRYEEAWLLSGKSVDVLNQFDYKCFRYAEIIFPAACRLDEGSLCLNARHYPFSVQAECNTSDPRLRSIWNLCIHSLRYGVQEVIPDCLEREKGQYLGDGCYTAIALGIVTSDFAIFKKLVREALRSSFVDPGLLACSPCSFMQEIAEYPLFLPMTCLQYYRASGDRAFLAEVFPGLKSVLLSYRDRYATESGLLNNIDKFCVVEWPPESRDGYDVPGDQLKDNAVCTTMHNTINAQYIGAVKFMNKMAEILEEPTLFDVTPLVKAYQNIFYDPASGLFRDAKDSSHTSVPSNAYALMMNLCPNRESEQKILAYIRERRLSGSMLFITYILFAALVRMGESELLLDLLEDGNGWLRMIREGSNTTMEAWGKDLKWNTSLFHLLFTWAAQFLTGWGMKDVLDWL